MASYPVTGSDGSDVVPPLGWPSAKADASARPCRYCLAAYPELFTDGDTTSCEFEHRDEPRIYELATAMARVFQQRQPTDEQVQWFLMDADAVVDDFDPQPEKWRIRRLPPTKHDEFVLRFRINDVTYICQDGNKERVPPIRLSALRAQQREADEAAKARMDAWLASQGVEPS